MSKITRRPTADELYNTLHNSNVAKRALDKALAEARDLAHWAGRRIPNGPTSGFMTQGYVIGHTGDLDLAIAQIIARVREETLADFITRNSVSHVARIVPGVYVASGTLRKADEYASPKMAHESKLDRNRRQRAVRDTGKCDSCGAEFVDDTPAFASGPAKRTAKQWREAFKRGTQDVPLMKPKRKAARLSGHEASILFPGDHDLSGFGSEQPWDAGSWAAAKVRPRKEKIPNHNESPTGALRGTPKRRSRK